MHKSLILITVLVATNMVAYGGLTVSTQKKSQVPSDTQIVTAVEGVEDVNNALGEIEDIRSQVNDASNRLDNVYTKSQTDTAILDKFNQTMHIGGEQTMTGIKTFMDGVRFTTVTNSLTGAAVTIQIRGTGIAMWPGKTPPSDPNRITRFTLPALGGTLITGAGVADVVDDVYASVYTKTQSDARFQPIGNYLELDADGMVPGSKVKMGTDSWAEQASPNDNANGIAYIYFNARGIGAYGGVYLTSLTFKTRTTYDVPQQDICLGISEISNNVQLAYSDLVSVRSTNTDYTFTLVKPLLLDGSKTYRVLFRNTQDMSALNVATGLALVTNTSSDPDSYVGTVYVDRPIIKDKRAVLKASWYVPATLDAMKGLIKSMTE